MSNGLDTLLHPSRSLTCREVGAVLEVRSEFGPGTEELTTPTHCGCNLK